MRSRGIDAADRGVNGEDDVGFAGYEERIGLLRLGHDGGVARATMGLEER